MKKTRFKAEQIVRILQETDKGDASIGDVCRRHQVSEPTFYRWRRIYGSMQVPDVKRLRELEQENARLKKLVAERDLEIDAMQEVLAKNV